MLKEESYRIKLGWQKHIKPNQYLIRYLQQLFARFLPPEQHTVTLTMKSFTSVALLSFACASFAQNFCTRVDPPSQCELGVPGTRDVEATTFTKQCKSTKALAVRELIDLSTTLVTSKNDSLPRKAAANVISTYFHVITKTTENSNQLVSNSTLDAQIKLMNKVYNKSGFQFRLDGINRRSNNSWVSGAELAPDGKWELKKLLRTLSAGTIALYCLRGCA